MTGPQEFNDQDQTRHNQGEQGLGQHYPDPQHPGQQGFGQQYPGQQQYAQPNYAQPGFPQPGYAPVAPARQKSQVGTRLMAFVARDIPALVTAGITLVMGLLLLVTPHLAWLKDNSFDIVEGTMTLSARGTIDLSSTAQRGLSNSDALEVGLVEIMFKTLAEPFAGMLTLSAVLVLIGGVLMLTTARQLGAVVALMGVIPQIIISVITALTLVITDDSPSSPQPSELGSGISAGAGVYLTVVAYVIVIICAAVAALRREGARPPAAPAGSAAGPATDPHAQYPARQPDSQQQSYPQQYGPEGPQPAGS